MKDLKRTAILSEVCPWGYLNVTVVRERNGSKGSSLVLEFAVLNFHKTEGSLGRAHRSSFHPACGLPGVSPVPRAPQLRLVAKASSDSAPRAAGRWGLW